MTEQKTVLQQTISDFGIIFKKNAAKTLLRSYFVGIVGAVLGFFGDWMWAWWTLATYGIAEAVQAAVCVTGMLGGLLIASANATAAQHERH